MSTIHYRAGRGGGDRPPLLVIVDVKVGKWRRYQCAVTELSLYGDYWQAAKQRHNLTVVPPLLRQEVAALDARLSSLLTVLRSRLAETLPEDIDTQWLRNEVDTALHPNKRKRRAVRTLLQAMQLLVDNADTRIIPSTGKPVGVFTKRHYVTALNTLKDYLKSKKIADIPLEQADRTFYDDFVGWCYVNGLKPNSVGNRIKVMKTAINQLPSDIRATCELVTDKACVRITEAVENVYLDESELEQLFTTVMPAYLAKVRDDFLLLAWTGCRYSDLSKITADNIVEVDGARCLSIEQRKTQRHVLIPILPVVETILARKNWKAISNQKFNDYIKMACEKAGIIDTVTITESAMRRGRMQRITRKEPKCELVSAHTARRSFATNMYKRGVPTLTIMAITGHKTEKAFLTYIKVTEAEHAQILLNTLSI